MLSIECMTCPSTLHVLDETELKGELEENKWVVISCHILKDRKPIQEHMCPDCVVQRCLQGKYVREVSKHGNGAHIIVPKEFIGKRVRLLIPDVKL